jgi:hypothetical protein
VVVVDADEGVAADGSVPGKDLRDVGIEFNAKVRIV